MKENIFEYKSYKVYLKDKSGAEHTKTGVKQALAKAIRCQSTYVSQILHGKAHLSMEQADLVNNFFNHTAEESTFFFLLVQKDRAGTTSLKNYFQTQIDQMLNSRLILTKRLGVKTSLTSEHQSIYYSSWLYSAVHIALTIPSLSSLERLVHFFAVSEKKIIEVLNFLVEVGLVENVSGNFRVTNAHIRLGKESHNILKHHTNWRVQAIESLEREEIEDLHYSGVVSLAKEDVLKIKNFLLDSIARSQEIIKISKEEELCAMNVDFFRLKRK